MLLLEDKYVKILGSALALGLVMASVVTAITAAQMPSGRLNMAGGVEGQAKIELAEQGTDIGQLSSESGTENKIRQPKMQASATQASSSEGKAAGSQNGTKDSDTKAPSASPEWPRSGLSKGDIWLMAQLIHAEGRGESLEGQVAIGAVLLNRTRDSRFPSSLAGVIYQPGAFCTVRDGQINLPPDSNALKAARLAASGWDPTGGALYFYNPARSTSRWIYTRPVINRIGRHVFAA